MPRRAVVSVDVEDVKLRPDLDLGSAEDHELAWYARQELPFLLDLM
jgi:hypothetical protein